jgi:hypothetical protein
MHTRAQKIITPIALAGALGSGLAAVTPAALAAPNADVVGVHVHRADLALRAVSSAAATGRLSIPLSELSSQMSTAAKISASLSLHAQTPNAVQVADAALKTVAREEIKAEHKLTAEASAVANVEQSAIAESEVKLDQGRELALHALGNLAIQAKKTAHAEAHVVAGDLAKLTAQGELALVQLTGVVHEVSAGSDCASSGDLVDLAATETANVRNDLVRVAGVASLLGSAAEADISSLADATASLKSELHVGISPDCGSEGDGSSDTASLDAALASASANAAIGTGTVVGVDTATGTDGTAGFEVHLSTPADGLVTVLENSKFAVLGIDGDFATSGSASLTFGRKVAS